MVNPQPISKHVYLKQLKLSRSWWAHTTGRSLNWERTCVCYSSLHGDNVDRVHRLYIMYIAPWADGCVWGIQEERICSEAVWPDVRVKSSPIFSKSCPKCSKCSFFIRVRFFKIAQKVPIISASFARNFVANNFPKSPNLVTLLARQRKWENRRERERERERARKH